MEKEKVLEKLQTRYFRKDLQDWGSFYTKQIYPFLKKEEGDEYEVWRGFYVSPNLDIVPARLYVYTVLDNQKVPHHMFLFSIVSRQGQVLASNL